jgi:hypothetical protein
MGLLRRFNADYRLSRRRPALRGINSAAQFAQKLGWSSHPTSAEALMSNACRTTGLFDYGPDDPHKSLAILLEALHNEGKMHPLGWLGLRNKLQQDLVCRLKIQRELQQYPLILDESVKAPLFIISLPRTGTTLLHKLLACDPNSRAPMYWETVAPVPHPRPERQGTDPPVANAAKELQILWSLAPILPTLHPMAADEADECNPMLGRTFQSYMYTFYCGLPNYTQWLGKRELTSAYEYHRLQLQILQFRCRTPRWVLKTPLHMPTIDSLLKVYPDATIVQTHRDPLKVISSTCSLVTNVRGLLSDAFPPERIGPEVVSIIHDWQQRSAAVRAAEPSRFFDVEFRDLVRNPIATIRELYHRLNLDYSDAFEANMVRWQKENPRHKHGVHHHSLEQFGLSQGALRELFGSSFLA